MGSGFAPRKLLEFFAMAYRQFRFDRQVVVLSLVGCTVSGKQCGRPRFRAQLVDGRWSWGGGLSLRGGPLRLALSARNVAGILYPMQAGHWSGQVGVAFEFGYAKDKKKTKKKGDLGNGQGHVALSHGISDIVQSQLVEEPCNSGA